MKTLNLGDGLTLPLAAVTATFGLLAVRGAGKSNTAAVMAEEMFAAGLPFVVVDPVGSWYGLRSGADGAKDGGLPIPIFGGRHGDLPLERGGGELVADLVASRRLSCVLDLSAFGSEADKKAFLLAFARRLYQVNTDPLHLFLEEADDYIPQRPIRDELQLLRAFENIVRRGRARGLGMTLITQRSAVVNKNVLTQVETLFAMRTTGPQDIAAIEAWVKHHQVSGEVVRTLAGLKPGEAWVWSPAFLEVMRRVQIRRRRTFDSGATPKNVTATDARKPATLADVDLGALRGEMAATIEKAKADDPKELKRRIAELEAATRTAARGSHDGGNNVTTEIREVLTDADRELLMALSVRLGSMPGELHGQLADTLATAIGKAIDQHQAMIERARREFTGLLDKKGFTRILETLARAVAPPVVQSNARHPRNSVSTNAGPARPVSTSDANRRLVRNLSTVSEGVTPVGQRILNSLAELEQLGARQPARELVAFMAGYTHLQSKGFVNAMSALSTAGFVTYGAGTVALTSEGRRRSVRPTAPRSAREVQDRVIAMLGGASGRILEPLIEAYPEPMPRQAVAERAGYGHLQSKGFVNAISRLRTLGFVDYPDRGSIVAKPVLFLEA